MDNPLIIDRDFNVVLNYDLDKLNEKRDTNGQCSGKVNGLLDQSEIHDL